VTALSAQTDNCKIITWNIRDFGKTKSDAEIELMAKILRGYDVIAIQEVVAKDPGGAQAVARLADAMDKTGANYDYSVSDPTQSSSPHTRERYAYIWRTSTVEMIGRPQLLSAYAKTIEREPYFATFSWEGKEFNVVNLHARPHDQHPEQEIAALRKLPKVYDDKPLFLVGDFNLVSKHSVFKPWLKRGYQLAAINQKTTLRKKLQPGQDGYSREKDNILIPAHQVQLLEGGSLDVLVFLRNDIDAANALSDHVPVYVVFDDFPRLEK
jgi:endonuclease/exonuclease/phosphatase family metal-dependent hydrolase